MATEQPAVTKPAVTRNAGTKNAKVGTVVSTKMAKTIVVEVSRRVPHPLYRRVVTRKKKFYAHDERGLAHIGDRVRITECRPLSKLKRWRLTDVIWQAARIEVSAAGEPADTAPASKRRKKS